jgi:nucleotide-binding universal stress UspA family protein
MVRPEVILGLDDSTAAAAALRWAATYARRSGLRLTAIHVSPFLADPPGAGARRTHLPSAGPTTSWA